MEVNHKKLKSLWTYIIEYNTLMQSVSQGGYMSIICADIFRVDSNVRSLIRGLLCEHNPHHKDIITVSKVNKLFRKIIQEQIDVYLRIYVVTPGLSFLGFNLKNISEMAINNYIMELRDCIWTGGESPCILKNQKKLTFVITLQKIKNTLPCYIRFYSLLPKQLMIREIFEQESNIRNLMQGLLCEYADYKDIISVVRVNKLFLFNHQGTNRHLFTYVRSYTRA